jgi:hypothetical protein
VRRLLPLLARSSCQSGTSAVRSRGRADVAWGSPFRERLTRDMGRPLTTSTSVRISFAASLQSLAKPFAIVGIRARRTNSLLDQKHSRTRIHARFNHHRRRVRDRSCGRAPVGDMRGSVSPGIPGYDPFSPSGANFKFDRGSHGARPDHRHPHAPRQL